MSKLKEYIVEVDNSDWYNLFLVSAQNAKDAVNIVWNEFFSWRVVMDREDGYRPTAKYELHAKSIERLHNSEGKVLLLN